MAGDRGSSLIEVLLATAILGIAVVVLIGGLGTAVLSTEQHRGQASAATYLRAAAEAVRSQPFQPCASTSSYSLAGVVPASEPTYVATITTLTHYSSASGSLVALSPCVAGADDVQHVALAIATTDGRVTETVTVGMRRP